MRYRGALALSLAALALAACNTTRTASDPVDAGTADDAPTADTGGDAASDPQADVVGADTNDVDAEAEDATDAALDVVDASDPDGGFDAPSPCADGEVNACGGCALLAAEPGDSCACGAGVVTCFTGRPDAVRCVDDARNELWPDLDGDGVGSSRPWVDLDCEQGAAAVTATDDCDDTRADVVPSAEPYCSGNAVVSCPDDGLGVGHVEPCEWRACGGTPATCTYTPWIVYTALASIDGVPDLDGHEQMFIVRADGSDAHHVPTGDVAVREPRWSPDGTRIAWFGWNVVDGPGARVLDVATGERWAIPGLPPWAMRLQWSLDGTELGAVGTGIDFRLQVWAESHSLYFLPADGSPADVRSQRFNAEGLVTDHALQRVVGELDADPLDFHEGIVAIDPTGEHEDIRWRDTWLDAVSEPTGTDQGVTYLTVRALGSLDGSAPWLHLATLVPGEEPVLRPIPGHHLGQARALRDGSALLMSYSPTPFEADLWLVDPETLTPSVQVTRTQVPELSWDVSRVDSEHVSLYTLRGAP